VCVFVVCGLGWAVLQTAEVCGPSMSWSIIAKGKNPKGLQIDIPITCD